MSKTFYVYFVEYEFAKIVNLRLWANERKDFEIIGTAPLGKVIYISATREGLENFKNNLQGLIIESIVEEGDDELVVENN